LDFHKLDFFGASKIFIEKYILPQ